MKEYEVTITETLQKTVTVEAESAAEAERLASEQWRAGEHVLDAECFTGVEFGVGDGREETHDKDIGSGGIEVLLVEPGQYPRIAEISGTLESMQDTVGGYIQAVYPFDDPVAIICDEEGKLKGSELNRAVKDESGNIIDIIAGTFFVCGLGEDDFTSLTGELRDKYEEVFRQPESFLKLGSRIMAIPVDPAERSAGGPEQILEER